MEGGDESEEGDIRKKDTIIKRNLRISRKKKIVALRTIIIIKFKRNIFKNYSPQILPRNDFFA